MSSPKTVSEVQQAIMILRDWAKSDELEGMCPLWATGLIYKLADVVEEILTRRDH